METDLDIKKRVDDQNEQENKLRISISEYRNELARVRTSSGELFEKQLSYISAGALGFSMLMVDKIAKDISLILYKPIIIISWIFFGLTLIINLLSHLYASHLHNKGIKDIDDDNYDSDKINFRNRKIELVNYVSVGTLLLGICFFVVFTSKNIYAMDKSAKISVSKTKRSVKSAQSNTSTEGYGLTPPPAPSSPKPKGKN
ncbi:MAG: hypothetical protein JNL72_13700 [Flavipsychrobacter sp.]|nr:hypothetical protein [Flavipsychrobacter sp.]